LQKQLQTALILSVTFIWSYPWVGLTGIWLYFFKYFFENCMKFRSLYFFERVGNLLHFWARNKVFGYGPNYRIELSELKPNVNLNIKLNLKQFQFWAVRTSFNRWDSHLKSSQEGRKCHFICRVYTTSLSLAWA
jgi:hypothetical protein